MRPKWDERRGFQTYGDMTITKAIEGCTKVYSPQKAPERRQRILELQALARRSGQAQLFIEAPYRNAALLRALLETLDGSTRLAVSAGLTLAHSTTRSASVSEWRTLAPLPEEALALPAVFAIGV